MFRRAIELEQSLQLSQKQSSRGSHHSTLVADLLRDQSLDRKWRYACAIWLKDLILGLLCLLAVSRVPDLVSQIHR